MKKEPSKKSSHSSKSKQNSLSDPLSSRNGKPFNYSAYAGRYTSPKHPAPDSVKQQVADDLRNWVQETKDYAIEDFFDSRNIPPVTYYRWVKDYLPLKEAHAYAKRRLAAKLNVGAIERKLDAGHVRFMLPHYGKQWRKTEEWRANLKKDANFGSGTIIVQIPEVPKSMMVPERKKDDDE